MEIQIRSYEESDLPAMTALWNDIVAAANSFPGEIPLNTEEAQAFFAAQTDTMCAFADGKFAGLYILHPNGIGRVAHTANASYGVAPAFRGNGVGKALVLHSLAQAKLRGFLGLQFNAVVSTNTTAIALYQKLGFTFVGTIPNGYRLKDGSFTDTRLFYKAV
jgi:ribosomal protein S18 acetylase RimI-like enzyme